MAMPYADPTSEAAVASNRRRGKAYYDRNREAEIKRCAAWNSANRERINANNALRRSTKKPIEYVLYWNAKNRAKAAGIEFSIEMADIVVPPACPALGIPLVVATGHAKDTSPSLDRIDPNKGYVPGNVQVISHKANTIKSNASLVELKAVLVWMEKSLG